MTEINPHGIYTKDQLLAIVGPEIMEKIGLLEMPGGLYYGDTVISYFVRSVEHRITLEASKRTRHARKP